MHNRQLERVARDLKRQRCEPEYIQHYLMEEYQCDHDQAQDVCQKIGCGNHGADGLPTDQPAQSRNKPSGFQRF